MNQKEVFTKIGGIIKELNDQYAYLQAEPGNLNSLELELFVSNARFLTNHIEILAKLNAQAGYTPPAPTPEPKQEPKDIEPTTDTRPETNEKQAEEIKPTTQPDQPVPHIDLGEAGGNDSYSYVRQEPETIRHELVLDDSINWEEGDEDLEEENEPPKIIHDRVPPVADKTDDTPMPVAAKTNEASAPVTAKAGPVEEKVKPDAPGKSKEDVLTINQKMSSQMAGKANPAPSAQDAPITDIKQAITLNDKLLFIKDLFNGYSLAYSEAIEILNRFHTFEEATTFLNKNYAVKNHWDSKPETAEKFYALLRRRYA